MCYTLQEKVNPTANIYSQITSLVRLQLLTAVGGFSIYFFIKLFLQIVFVSILCVFYSRPGTDRPAQVQMQRDPGFREEYWEVCSV
jgi:hypothetical protein